MTKDIGEIDKKLKVEKRIKLNKNKNDTLNLGELGVFLFVRE